VSCVDGKGRYSQSLSGYGVVMHEVPVHDVTVCKIKSLMVSMTTDNK
jgi:hypothetical protein